MNIYSIIERFLFGKKEEEEKNFGIELDKMIESIKRQQECRAYTIRMDMEGLENIKKENQKLKRIIKNNQKEIKNLKEKNEIIKNGCEDCKKYKDDEKHLKCPYFGDHSSLRKPPCKNKESGA